MAIPVQWISLDVGGEQWELVRACVLNHPTSLFALLMQQQEAGSAPVHMTPLGIWLDRHAGWDAVCCKWLVQVDQLGVLHSPDKPFFITQKFMLVYHTESLPCPHCPAGTPPTSLPSGSGCTGPGSPCSRPRMTFISGPGA